jgi:hypothetical protein
MLESYSLNQSVLTGGLIPFNSTPIVKGDTVNMSGVSAIQLNRCGVYEVTFNMTATATTAGNITVSMTKNGTIQPQTTRTITGATATTSANIPITTLVQVAKNNTECCCTSPTIIQFVNTGVGVTANNCNLVVTKIC